MTTMSRSQQRYTFQASRANSDEFTDIMENIRNQDFLRDSDLEWQKNNMEYDLRTTDWILEKVRNSEQYAQNLYAAMCNNRFQQNDVMPILKDQYWSCSWRYAGGIIADMRQEGDYIDYYCSGIRDSYEGGYVSETVITDEIREDLFKLGWLCFSDDDELI
jgi:hypothetical protein